MKKFKLYFILALVNFTFLFSFGQTTLNQGDIMIVTLNADNDFFDFIPLINLETGTEIKFSDDAWDGALLSWRGGEGILTYLVTTAISEGTVISYTGPDANWSKSGSYDLATTGDNLLSYQGTEANPTFICGIGSGQVANLWNYPAGGNTNSSDIPAILSVISNTIVSLGTTDNYQYNIANGISGTKNSLLSLIANSSNWHSDDTSPFGVLTAIFDNTEEGKLPIELISFFACNNNNCINIKWSTASEINNDYFTIERSINADNFEIIKVVHGAGNSNSVIYYSEIDDFPLQGIIYYRLKQTDYNGNFSYSKTISVENGFENSLKILSVFSSHNSISITVINPKFKKIYIEIIDESGKVIITSRHNFDSDKSIIVLNSSHLTHGIFFIKLSSDDEIIIKKLLY